MPLNLKDVEPNVSPETTQSPELEKKEKPQFALRSPNPYIDPTFIKGYRVKDYFIEFENDEAKRDVEAAFQDDMYCTWTVRMMDSDDMRLYCFFVNRTKLGPVPMISRVLYQDEKGKWYVDFAQLERMMGLTKKKLEARLYFLTWLGVIQLIQQKDPKNPPIQYNEKIEATITDLRSMVRQ